MGSLLVVTGPPGAGKSTVSAALAARVSPSVLVRGDDFFAFLASGAIAPWRPESNRQNEIVTEAAGLATGRLAVDYATIYDGILGPWALARFAAASGLAALDYLVILPSVGECVARVQRRVGHDFSDEAATRHMHAEFARATIDSRHVLQGDSRTLEETVTAIRDAKDIGLLRHERGA